MSVTQLPRLKALTDKLTLGLATEADFEGIPAVDVMELKQQPLCVVRSEAYESKVHDSKSRVIRYIGSSEHRDRVGDVIRQRGRADGPGANGSGWTLKNYARAGGPFFWCHRSDEPAIGSAQRAWVDDVEIEGKVQPALLFDIQYLLPGVSELSNLAWNLASGEGLPNGVPAVRATSVGFRIIKSYWPQDAEERELLNLGPWGIEIQEAELLELSLAPVPCNPFAVELDGKTEKAMGDALDHLVGAGHASRAAADLWIKKYGLGPSDALERARSRVRGFVDMGAAVKVAANAAAAAIAKADEDAADEDEGCTLTFSKQEVASLRAAHDYSDQALQIVGSVLDKIDGTGDQDVTPGELSLDAAVERVLESALERMMVKFEQRIAQLGVTKQTDTTGGEAGALAAPPGSPLPEAKEGDTKVVPPEAATAPPKRSLATRLLARLS